MAKHQGKLTKRVVDAWKGHVKENGEIDPFLWDGKLPGYGIRINANGTRTAVVQYRNRYRTSHRYTIGVITDALTADQARSKAIKLLRDAASGNDPAKSKTADRRALKVNDLLDLYLASAKFAQKAESTRKTDIGRIKRHLRPTVGSLRLAEIDKEVIRKAQADIANGKTAVVEKTANKRGKAVVTGGEGAARMAIRVLRAIFSWGVEQQLLESNPAHGIKLGNDGRRTAHLTREQYASLFSTLSAMEDENSINRAEGAAIRVLAFTGARRNEITKAKWGWIDLEKGTIRVPPKSHKSGHITNEAKVIPLPSAARAVIAAQPRGEADDWVFASKAKKGASVGLSGKLWKRIRASAGLPDGIANHALRHSLGSTLALSGAEAAQIKAVLGHSQISTTERYMHIARDARTQILETHSLDIVAAMQADGKVVELKQQTTK